jgi:hypothetical protein
MHPIDDFKTLMEWYATDAHPLISSFHCPTRDVFEGRLARLPELVQRQAGASREESFLMAAVAGEIGNNSFDHNLGHWQHEPGLHFGFWCVGPEVSLLLADHGRGVYASLSAVHKHIADEQSALELAFHKKISGRFPEQRGNGLKFVRQIVNCDKDRGIWCQSGTAEVAFGKLGQESLSRCATTPTSAPPSGTITHGGFHEYSDPEIREDADLAPSGPRSRVHHHRFVHPPDQQ